ncbi:MAG: hypothetical protein KAG19_05340 [Methylococcales bacterium]|nr:hypothetical protein [Methylococcales bacterium]
MIKTSLTIILLNTFVSTCWADAEYTGEPSNQLQIPFVRYQDQFYQADLTYLPPDKLMLDSAIAKDAPKTTGNTVPVYSDLSFHLSNIKLSDQQYAADMQFLGGNIFQIHNLIEVQNTPVGRQSVKSKHFTGSGVCAQCHDDIYDEAGTDVSIVEAWETSMMANATKDPFWQAKVRSELNRTPSQADVINDTCSRCHAPMANEEARKQGAPVQPILGKGGILAKGNPYHDLAMNAVSCSLCHQISPDGNFGTEAGFSGNFAIKSYDKKSERLIYGPFQDLLTMPMQMFASFTPVFSSHIKTSALCASCHELTTPYTDENGTILSTKEDEFPEQTPYTEWLLSDFAEFGSCQQCHMEKSSGVIIASQPEHLETKRDGFSQHSFLGSNRLMLSILQDNRKQLGVKPKDFSASLKNAALLLKRAAKIKIDSASLQEKSLSFNVNINSETGHKFPSAYPSRRVILHVTIQNKAGDIVFESGKVNKDGSVVSLDSDHDATTYEPHYNLIESPEQVQVYETVMHDYKGNVTFTLLRAKSYLKDNRLLPNGFDKNTAPRIVKVHGKAATDNDFIGGGDSVKFKIPHLAENEYTIQAELIYQTLGYAFAQDLFKDKGNEISRFKQMFNSSPLKSTITQRTTKRVSQ